MHDRLWMHGRALCLGHAGSAGKPSSTGRVGKLVACLLLALAAWLFLAPGARADACPPIKDKPGAIPHVSYPGVQHLTYCYGPVDVQPGQNIIRLNPTNLFPQVPGYITRFDPELVYTDGTVPRVDVLHLHHAVWIVNLNPQFATGEEKTIVQLPRGFGWRSRPTDRWYLNDMIHDLVGAAASVYVVWRLDFVPDTTPAAASIHTVQTKWMDVAGLSFYPVFDAVRGMGHGGRYTFPDEATGASVSRIGAAATWNVDRPATLIGTAGHLHPGGLSTQLRVDRAGQENTLFTSKAHYFEPAGAVSWDVAMGATPPDWRVIVKPGDTVSVHATYDVKRADWYEVMGIMPVAVYYGTDVGGVDALSKKIDAEGVLTHGHLDENRNHGGDPTTYLADSSLLPSAPAPSGPVGIENYQYEQGDLGGAGPAANPPAVLPGQSLTFLNHDAAQTTFHTITSCKAPCNRSTGIAYPIANGPVSFDSGQLGFNVSFHAPAADRDTWTTPVDLKPGTYDYFCRVHPFMRGSFRVLKPNGQAP
jgi:plastocyanin